MKKIIAVILALVLALSVSAIAFADEAHIRAEITFDEQGNPYSSNDQVIVLGGLSDNGAYTYMVYAPIGTIVIIGTNEYVCHSRKTEITVNAPSAPVAEEAPVANTAPEPAPEPEEEAPTQMGFFARIIAWLQALFSGFGLFN